MIQKCEDEKDSQGSESNSPLCDPKYLKVVECHSAKKSPRSLSGSATTNRMNPLKRTSTQLINRPAQEAPKYFRQNIEVRVSTRQKCIQIANNQESQRLSTQPVHKDPIPAASYLNVIRIEGSPKRIISGQVYKSTKIRPKTTEKKLPSGPLSFITSQPENYPVIVKPCQFMPIAQRQQRCLPKDRTQISEMIQRLMQAKHQLTRTFLESQVLTVMQQQNQRKHFSDFKQKSFDVNVRLRDFLTPQNNYSQRREHPDNVRIRVNTANRFKGRHGGPCTNILIQTLK